MRRVKNKTTKELFKIAYRIARQPDIYMASDTDGMKAAPEQEAINTCIIAIAKARGEL